MKKLKKEDIVFIINSYEIRGYYIAFKRLDFLMKKARVNFNVNECQINMMECHL